MGVVYLTANLEERACDLAVYMIENKATVRAAAAHFGISKSTVHTVDAIVNGLKHTKQRIGAGTMVPAPMRCLRKSFYTILSNAAKNYLLSRIRGSSAAYKTSVRKLITITTSAKTSIHPCSNG